MVIYLVGYMACGKTTLGEALCARGYADFVDLDHEIESASGLTPAEWFALRGEGAFRVAVREALERLAASGTERTVVVATGGGTASNADAMDFMLSHGRVVWLEASLERTIERLLDAPGQRPLVAGMDADGLRAFIPSHLSQREPFYARAHQRFDSSRLDTEAEVADSVGRFIRLIGIT